MVGTTIFNVCLKISLKTLLLRERHCNRYDNHHQDDDDPNNKTNAHLKILPPHVLSHPVSSPTEALSGDGQVVRFVFYGVQALTSFGDLIDIVPHNTHGIIDLLNVSE